MNDSSLDDIGRIINRVEINSPEDVIPSPQPAGITDATQIIELAQRLQLFRQMYLFIKCCKKPGQPVQVIAQVHDAHKVSLALTGEMVSSVLVQEFDALGKAIDAAGVDTSKLLQEVDSQYLQMYSVGG